VRREQDGAGHFFGEEKMADRAAGKVLAGMAVAIGFDGGAVADGVPADGVAPLISGISNPALAAGVGYRTLSIRLLVEAICSICDAGGFAA